MNAIMDVEISPDMISHAMDKELEKAAWDIWIAKYPYFTEESFVPFSEFKTEQIKEKYKKKRLTSEEIEEEMMPIIEAYERRKAGEKHG